ncbi:hypothetical protein ACHAXS_000173 [Conticribra weissflogii]
MEEAEEEADSISNSVEQVLFDNESKLIQNNHHQNKPEIDTDPDNKQKQKDEKKEQQKIEEEQKIKI